MAVLLFVLLCIFLTSRAGKYVSLSVVNNFLFWLSKGFKNGLAFLVIAVIISVYLR